MPQHQWLGDRWRELASDMFAQAAFAQTKGVEATGLHEGLAGVALSATDAELVRQHLSRELLYCDNIGPPRAGSQSGTTCG